MDRICGVFTSKKVDLGDPVLNLTVDGFLKIGAVAATKVVADETFHYVKRGNSISRGDFEESLKKMCKEGAYWGTTAAVYVGTEYGIEKIRGKSDWTNALVSGAITGAIASAALHNNKEKIISDAILGGAVATAGKFLNSID